MFLLTLVVPTKDRQEYVEQIVRAYIELEDPRIKLIIHDNSPAPMESEALTARGVQYIHYPEVLSMHENFTQALSHVNTKYLCISGDDDFLCHYISQVVTYLERNDIDVMVSKKAGRYWWVDVNHRVFGKFFAGQLRVPWHREKLRVETLNTKAALRKCLKIGGTEIEMMPKAYHGIVKTSLLRMLENSYGSAFPGPTPDMASSALLALTLSSFHRVNLPFFVSGTAAGSAGGKGVSKRHKWKLEETPWFDKKYLSDWHVKTPRVACGPSLWAEGILQAHAVVGRNASLNWPALYGRVLAADGFSVESLITMAKMNKSEKSLALNGVLILWYFIKYQAKRFVSLLDNLICLLTGLSWSGRIYRRYESPVDVIRALRLRGKC